MADPVKPICGLTPQEREAFVSGFPKPDPRNSTVIAEIVEELRTGESTSARLQRAEQENEYLRQELAAVGLIADTLHLEAARPWRVAETDAGPCARCGRPIVRSQAVEPMPGTTNGSYAHVVCPTP